MSSIRFLLLYYLHVLGYAIKLQEGDGLQDHSFVQLYVNPKGKSHVSGKQRASVELDAREETRLRTRVKHLRPTERISVTNWLAKHSGDSFRRLLKIQRERREAALARKRNGAAGKGTSWQERTPYREKAFRQVLSLRSHGLANTQAIGIGVVALAACTGGRVAAGPKHWPSVAVASSFALLLPGLLVFCFHAEIAVDLVPEKLTFITGILGLDVPQRVLLTQQGPGTPGAMGRSILGLVWYLNASGCKLGAFFMVIFAITAPACVFVCMFLYWHSLLASLRHAASPMLLRAGRAAREAVQVLVKMPCAGVFALSILYHFMRSIQKPELAESMAVLDIGFTCFTAFSLLLLIGASSLEDLPAAEGGGLRKVAAPLVLRYFGRRGVMAVAVVLGGAWVPLFLLGILRPCITLEVNEKVALHKQASTIGVPFMLFKATARILKIDIVEIFASRLALADVFVGLWRCFRETADVNVLLAAVMVTLFGLLFTATSVGALACEGCGLGRSAGSCAAKTPGGRQIPSRVLFVLRQLSLCDAMIAGCVAVVICGRIYRPQGMQLSLEVGLLYLILSEVVHMLLSWVVYETSEFYASQVR